jgi:small subunit ribosomal protein S4e
MHRLRAEFTKKVPIPRKGTKYVARPLSHLNNSVPVVIAIRDMLKLAITAKEVKEMIKQKLLKINGKEVRDYRESIRLFNILEADKLYFLTLTENGRFAFEETKSKERICKVINKKILKNKKIQLNLHDGSNVLPKEKININDSVYLDFSGKITGHIPFEKGRTCFVISGKYLGNKAKIEELSDKVKLKLKDKQVVLEKRSVVVI